MLEQSMATLDSLVPGQRALIETIEGPPTILQRLLEMGLTEGEEVELVRRAPLGDPLEIRVRSYELSLRKTEAALVAVRVL
jgi:Fe2+ transport system protein FeoA